jgi:hypothetical protein
MMACDGGPMSHAVLWLRPHALIEVKTSKLCSTREVASPRYSSSSSTTAWLPPLLIWGRTYMRRAQRLFTNFSRLSEWIGRFILLWIRCTPRDWLWIRSRWSASAYETSKTSTRLPKPHTERDFTGGKHPRIQAWQSAKPLSPWAREETTFCVQGRNHWCVPSCS